MYFNSLNSQKQELYQVTTFVFFYLISQTRFAIIWNYSILPKSEVIKVDVLNFHGCFHKDMEADFICVPQRIYGLISEWLLRFPNPTYSLKDERLN